MGRIVAQPFAAAEERLEPFSKLAFVVAEFAGTRFRPVFCEFWRIQRRFLGRLLPPNRP
jgi:hypothetical protein